MRGLSTYLLWVALGISGFAPLLPTKRTATVLFHLFDVKASPSLQGSGRLHEAVNTPPVTSSTNRKLAQQGPSGGPTSWRSPNGTGKLVGGLHVTTMEVEQAAAQMDKEPDKKEASLLRRQNPRVLISADEGDEGDKGTAITQRLATVRWGLAAGSADILYRMIGAASLPRQLPPSPALHPNKLQ
ncbi:hypothetical protein Efla_005810 [Eimeria flavescens]